MRDAAAGRTLRIKAGMRRSIDPSKPKKGGAKKKNGGRWGHPTIQKLFRGSGWLSKGERDKGEWHAQGKKTTAGRSVYDESSPTAEKGKGRGM